MQIKISHDDFLKYGSNITAKNVLICDDGISLETNKEGLKYLALNNVLVKRLDKTSFHFIFKHKIGFILGFFLFLSALIINNERINKIEFNGDFPINQAIYFYLEDNLKHLGPLSFLKADLKEINYSLRQRYSGYEWISVEKNGNSLYVEITRVGEGLITQATSEKGNLISKATGIVKEFRIYEGKHELYANKYVKAGDILVLGLGKEARGLILGEVYDYKEIKIKKQIAEDMFTGDFDNYERFTIFGCNFLFHKDKAFMRFDENEKKIFDLGIIKYYDIQELEKCDIMTIYNYDEAYQYAKSIIIQEFNQNKEYQEEKIMAMELYQKSEDEDYFYFTFLVQKQINLGMFIKE